MDNKILIAYFSKTNTTKSFAEKLGKILHANLYQIEEQDPYKPEDINWTVKDCRANRENADPTCRPAMRNKKLSLDFDTLLLGFPLWWGEAPRIIQTFLESYDFTNKKIILFCTSQMTPIYQTQMNLKYQYPKIHFISGARVNSFSDEQLLAWTKTFKH